MRKSIWFYLGNLLIVASFFLMFFTYFPFFQLFFMPISNPPTESGYFLSIPKISASAPIITDIDPWEENLYRPALEKGVAQVKNTSFPGQEGTIYLFAHSSLPPWQITRFNTAFLRLGELQNGDQINLIKDGVEYKYQVVDKKEVWPNEVEYLRDATKTQVILQTCVPLGTSVKRLLVFADPV